MSRTLVVDDDDDLRLLLCEVVRSVADGECVAVGSFEQLVARGAEALACDLALLDVNLGVDVPSGLDALEWLRAHEFRGRIVFLTGHARTHPLVERARQTAGVSVVDKPVPFETVVSLLSGSESA